MVQKSMPMQVRQVVNQMGQKKITKIQIARKPVFSIIQNLLNAFTGGALKDKLKQYNYDDLYHLGLILTFESGETVILQKNENVNTTMSPKVSDYETVDVFIPTGLSLNLGQVISSTMNFMGLDNFFNYNAKTNNCQVFVTSVLKANRLWNQSYNSFINQPADKLVFDSMPEPLEKVVNAVTDTAGVVADIMDYPTKIVDYISEGLSGKAQSGNDVSGGDFMSKGPGVQAQDIGAKATSDTNDVNKNSTS